MDKKNIRVQKGIILKKFSYGEADEIITVLLENEGLCRFFVKGSRKSKKRFLGRIDHFAHLSFTYYPRTHGLTSLLAVQDVASVPNSFTRPSVSTFAFSSLLAELIMEFIREGDGDHGLYALWLQMQDVFQKNVFSYELATQYLLIFFSLVGYDTELHRFSATADDKARIKQLIGFSESIIQKSLQTSDFFLSFSAH